MKQYQSIKDSYPDAIVLFRVGDFYEMFGEDAIVASKILQIALTTRDKGKENPVPMCGIPYFASDSYITKLIGAGKKVAICEQVEDPKDAKGIVRREVVRLITPGTHFPEQPKENSFIMSFFPQGDAHGIAVADVSTGDFIVYESQKPLEDEISIYSPREILVPESLIDDIHYSTIFEGHYISKVGDEIFDPSESYKSLLRHFGVTSLEGYGLGAYGASIQAAGALISYLEQVDSSLRFRKISVKREQEFMFIDSSTQRNLELLRNLRDGSSEATLLWALDETFTPMGGRFLRNAIVMPLLDIEAIRNRQSAVGRLFEDYELMDVLRRNLRKIQDIERIERRISLGSANARDLIALKNSLSVLPEIREALLASKNELLISLGNKISDFSPVVSEIERAIAEHPPLGLRDGGIIKDGYSPDIDELREISKNGKSFIASMEAEERKKTGISSLKIGYNKIFGYYIEVTKPNLELVPERYIRKQTLLGAERFITPELKEYETKVLGAEERLKALEFEVFRSVLSHVADFSDKLLTTSEALAEVDFLHSLAIVAKRHDYTCPKVNDSLEIKITEGRHPVLERLASEERFIPNDTFIGEDQRLLIITGPNMAGKSTYMRQVALIVLMAQMGGFVPAREAVVGVSDRIFTRIGASDFISKGQSTFMVEMVETANILNSATERSLIVLDEIGRGTSTFDGISIAWAAAEYIVKNIKARTLFATHYNELTELPMYLGRVKNLSVAVREWGDEIIFLRKIEDGPADRSYGIQVARLAGLPDEVIKKAKEVLSSLEKEELSGAGRRRFKMSDSGQLDLFAQERDSFISELRGLKLEGMTPEDAIKKLQEIKKRAGTIP